MFGLLGEGVLPPANLAQSIASVGKAFVGHLAPTAVVTRSRLKGAAGTPSRWLSDGFVAQVWCNRAMLTESLDFADGTFQDSTLLEVLPRLLGADRTGAGSSSPILVDGTHLLPSVFAERASRNSSLLSSGSEVTGGSMMFGTLELALVRDNGDGGDVGDIFIGKAPWPPVYLLEYVAMERGLILVNSVNCGYLDMAINFLLAARKVVNDVKVALWVAVYRVSV